jgi:hypothetical protein
MPQSEVAPPTRSPDRSRRSPKHQSRETTTAQPRAAATTPGLADTARAAPASLEPQHPAVHRAIAPRSPESRAVGAVRRRVVARSAVPGLRSAVRRGAATRAPLAHRTAVSDRCCCPSRVSVSAFGLSFTSTFLGPVISFPSQSPVSLPTGLVSPHEVLTGDVGLCEAMQKSSYSGMVGVGCNLELDL